MSDEGMRVRRGGWLLLALWLLAPLTGWAGDVSSQALALGMQLPKAHKLAPAFSLPDLTGRHVSLTEQRGHWVLLHFWATWCPPCRQEMRQLFRIWRMHRDGALHIMCVNVNRGDADEVRRFMQDAAPGMPTLLDRAGEVHTRYAVRALPTSYLIAPDGRIFARAIGQRDWLGQDAQKLLQALLGEERE